MNTAHPGMQAQFARALLDPEAPCPEGLHTWNHSDPAARLAVYRNNVVGSLINALADTFPVTQALVGPAFFRAMAGVFVRACPPRSALLAFYGRDMPAFIDTFAPAQTVPCLADVARLEMARVDAYHAADALPLPSEDVQRALASGESIGRVRLCCHPSVQVVSSCFAIFAVWAAHQGDGDPAPFDPDTPQSVLVVRQDQDVLVVHLHRPGTAEFICAALEGATLAEAASRAIGASAEFDLSHALGLLMAHGALTALELPQGPCP